jgi:predicted patatin/cPLA2 family phospholipase
MIAIENANDFEMFSSTSAGGMQGNGYQCRNAGYCFHFLLYPSTRINMIPLDRV